MNEKQILELKQLVDQLTDQGLPNEEIQAQVDLRKQEFKQLNESVKTTPVEKDATAGEEIASDMESLSDPGSSDLVGPSETADPTTDFIPYETPKDAEKAKLDIERENIGFFQNLINATREGLIDPKKGIKNKILMGVLNGLEMFDVTKPEDRGKIFEALQKIKTPGLTMGGAIPNQGLIPNMQSVDDLEAEQAELQKKSKKFEYGGPTEAIFASFDNILDGEISEAGENLFEAFESGLTGAVKSAPSLIAASTGLGGLALYGLSISGNKFAEEIELNPDETLTRLNINALGSGAIETAFELVTHKLLKGAGIISGKQGANAAKEFINRGVKKIAKTFGFTWLMEGGSEAATEITNILWDNGTLSRDTMRLKTKEGLYRVGDGFILGSIMSTPITAFNELNALSPAAKERAETLLTPISTRRVLNDAASQISDLQVKFTKAKSPRSKKIIQDKINSLEAQIIKTKKDVSFVLENMTPVELEALATNQDKIEKTRMAGMSESDPGVRKTLTEDLKTLQQENFDLFDTVNKRVLEQKLIKDKEAAKSIMDVESNIQEFNNAEGLLKVNPEADPDSDAGILPDGKIFINKERAAKTGAVTAGSHEIFHYITEEAFKNKRTRAKLVKEFKETLTPEELLLVEERIKSNYSTNEDGSKKKREEYNEEYFAAFSDIVGKDKKYNESLSEKFIRYGKAIINIFKDKGFSKIKFESGKDVYDFIIDYQKNIKRGKLSERAIEMAKTRTGVEGVQKFSKSDSDAVQTIFEQKGKEGAFEIIEKFKPITNKLVQRRSEAPSFDRQLLTDEIETGKRGIIDLINEYDASKGVPLAAYINKFLPARAIEASNRVLDTEFKLDVTEAKGVTDTTTEEVTERVAEKPTKAKESLRKKIKLDKATTQKVIDAVTKTFGTKLPPVDSPQFKKALQKGFRTELKTTIAKDVLGSRAAYETFLRDNFENIYEAIPQDIINKRFRQFAEDTGKREKTKEGKKIFKKKDIAKAEFINYFLGRDVGTSTKGTRKDALAEALAEEFAFDATMEVIQKPEVIEKREFVDKTQTTEKVSKAISRPIDLKFSKSELLNANESVLQKSFEISDDDFSRNDEDWGVLLKILNVENFDVSGKDREVVLEKLKTTGLIKELPEIFIRNFQGVSKAKIFNKNGKNYVKKLNTEELIEVKKIKNKWKAVDGKKLPKIERLHDRQVFFKNVEEADAWIKQAKEEGYTFAPETQMWKDLFTKTPYTKTVNKKEVFSLKNKFNDIKFIKQQDNKIKALKETFLIFEKFIKKGEGKENAAVVAALLKSTSSWQGHFIRLSSPVKFYSLGQLFDPITNKKLFTEEHTLPASAVAKYLFVQAANGTVNKNFKNIERNYFQGALLNIDDNKLSGIGVDGKKFSYKSRTPDGWTLEDNVWSRYFNPNVANVNFGIDPNSLMTYQGKTVYEIYGVDNAGNFIDIAYNKAIAEPAVINNNKLPSTVKLSKTNLFNNKVLNKMKTLDTEAQDARIKFSKSKDLNKDFNDIIERATGIGTEKRYGQTKARAIGADKGKFNLLGIPPSAQDFVGLTRYFAGKGKQGDETIAWIKENFLDPFARANIDISNARVALANDFKALKKLLGVSPKDLNKKIAGEPYTVGNAVRVYTWIQQGMTIPGLSKADQKILEDYVTADENLVTFANELIAINKDNGYPKPQESWLAGTITTDLLSGLNTVVRAKYLKQWQGNVNEVFNETNLNKLEAAYGKSYREALENILGRMKSGSNRGVMGDSLTGRFVDWLNGSIGAIMFFNMRSAVLQTISAVNFVNWSDNNPLKAAAAFGNQPQYWSDVIKLMNSDYLVERRNGLKINVNEADIAEIAAESKNKAKAFISKLLKLGFLPTQIADSFAIASGGATFYRNRLKSLIKDGMSQKEAEAQAFQDFREIAEESQQSSRPDRISAQQAGPMGRVILAFANTPAQYARLMQKAASDLKNRRGDDKTNISKILYYGAIQNVIFNALQQALFAMAFGDEEPDEEAKNKKYTGIVNGMADSLLRGLGFHGAAISTLKNAIMKLAEGKEAQDAAIELLDISPPISSKIGKLKSAGRTWDWNKKEIMEKGFSLDNPAYLAAGQVVSAATNVPLDRGIRKLQNLKDASDAENEEWIRVANALGWAKWELEWQKDKPSKKKIKIKTRGSSRKTKSRSSNVRKQLKRK
jgi:DNA-binding transcriptional MerR regulator